MDLDKGLLEMDMEEQGAVDVHEQLKHQMVVGMKGHPALAKAQ